nr:hypothetical protein [uncultured Draconibacterium sp.]
MGEKILDNNVEQPQSTDIQDVEGGEIATSENEEGVADILTGGAEPTVNEGETAGSSARDAVIAIAQKYFPDASFETDDNVFATILPLVEKMDGLHTWLNESVEEEPAAGDMLIDIKNGYSWEQAIARNFEMDALASPEGTEDYEKVQQYKAERRQRVQSDKDREKMWGENEEISAKNLIAVVEELGLDDETAENAVTRMGQILADAADRVISVENWKSVINGLRHDAIIKEKEEEIENARAEGEKAGKNQKIEKKRISEKDLGDGVPKLKSGSSSNTEKAPKKTAFPTKEEFRV